MSDKITYEEALESLRRVEDFAAVQTHEGMEALHAAGKRVRCYIAQQEQRDAELEQLRETVRRYRLVMGELAKEGIAT